MAVQGIDLTLNVVSKLGFPCIINNLARSANVVRWPMNL